MPERAPRCAVIIPTYNGASLTEACVEALLASPPSACRWTIVVVDDASTDRTSQKLARFGSDIRIARQEVNLGFAGACNEGALAAADCDYLVFLNNDTIPTAGWLDALVEEAGADKQVAAVGAKLLFPNGLVQHAGVAIGQDRWPHHLYTGFDGEHPAVNRPKQVTAATAACLLVTRADFEQLGGFDTAFRNGYEDIDLCLRLGLAGRLIRYCPRSVVYHLESVTRWPSGVPQGTEESDGLYERRWRSTVTPDDIQHYIDDGLLALSYGPHYPLTMAVSPDLAVTRTDGAELGDLERLLASRSEQVMDLLRVETRRQLAGSPQALVDSLTPGHRLASTEHRLASAEHVADGGEHRLGRAGGRHLISIVMPVKNGAPALRELLPAILQQSISARLEIVAVDSGSEDDTIEVLRHFGATVLSVDAAEFDHGLTRNLAAEHARGEVLVFVSQWCRPHDKRWLAPLVAALEEDPEVVGACSRVVPRIDADILSRRDGERDLSFSADRQRKQIGDWQAYRRMSAQQLRVFLNFHTVSAAVRADAVRRNPFRSVRTIGEDLLWAREVLEAGWAVVHEPASVVHHSHAYSLSEWFSRNVDDGIANRDITGLSLDSGELVELTRTLVQDDWRFLSETLGLDGPALERWRLESALRRGAQVVGQWVGVNYQSLPDGTASRFSGVERARFGSRRERVEPR